MLNSECLIPIAAYRGLSGIIRAGRAAVTVYIFAVLVAGRPGTFDTATVAVVFFIVIKIKLV